MNTIVNTNWDPGLIALSFAFAVIGSFVALSAATRIRNRRGALDWNSVFTVGIALGGVGVWSMHFIGKLALQMDVGSSYAMLETLISLVAAILATAGSVAFAAQRPESFTRLLSAGVLLGMSVVVMHYLGMFGLKIYGFITWDMALVGASMVIAVVAATAALWLAFNSKTLGRRVAASVVMGIAVCAMHYTGMAAAEFVCTTTERAAIPQGTGFISAFRLPLLVIATTVMLTVLLSLDQLYQHLRGRAMRAARA